jgi:hypothetical protein
MVKELHSLSSCQPVFQNPTEFNIKRNILLIVDEAEYAQMESRPFCYSKQGTMVCYLVLRIAKDRSSHS